MKAPTTLELLAYLKALRAERAPTICPTCHNFTSGCVRDGHGLWTWNCKEGCNP